MKGLTTGEIVGDMITWQNRPLGPMYPVVLIDAIVIKVGDAQVADRPVCVAIGVVSVTCSVSGWDRPAVRAPSIRR